jgi:hypothetical protein
MSNEVEKGDKQNFDHFSTPKPPDKTISPFFIKKVIFYKKISVISVVKNKIDLTETADNI